MKNVLEVRKLFWLINSVLLIILICIVVVFILGGDAGKNTFAFPIPMKDHGEIISLKSPFPPANHKIIVERNIFGSSGLSPANENKLRENTATATSVHRAQFRLLATVAGDDQVACAVIENLKSKVQDIYKAGDIINGAQIERIDRNKIVLFYEGRREVLKLYISFEVVSPVEKNDEPVIAQKQNLPEPVNVVTPFEMEIDKRTSVTQVPAIEVFLEKVEVAPYMINGRQEGLSITGLDDLNTDGYFGFENGDIIQTINGQMLTDEQKAFQVLKKARALSSLNFQLLRNRHKMNLSFDIKR